MKESIRYLAFGDSLTVGYGAASGRGFVPQFAKTLTAALGRNVQTSNAGVIGATTENLLESLRSDPDIRVKVKQAGIMTITAGGNDLIQAALPFVYEGDAEILKAALQTFDANFKQMLETIRDIKGVASEPKLIILIGLYNPLPLLPDAAVWVCKFNKHLKELSGRNVRFVDIYDAFVGRERELLYSDRIHPNAKGYAAIAEEIERTVPAKAYQSIV